MSRIEYREMPHRNMFSVNLKYGAAGDPATADEALIFVAKKRTWVHQISVYFDSIGGADANLQLEAFAVGERGETTGGSTFLTNDIDIGSGAGGGVANGNIITSDMGLAALINDAQAADFSNATDIFDMDGTGVSPAVLAATETPFQLEPGAGLIVALTGVNISPFIGEVEVMLGEDPI